MLLISYNFIAFLTGLVILYYIIPKRLQWHLLLAASYLFFSMTGWKALVFILLSTLSVWMMGLQVGRLFDKQKKHFELCELTKAEKKDYRKRIKRKQRNYLLVGIFINFGLLICLKYTNFALDIFDSLRYLFGRTDSIGRINWILPLGISYYTLQSVGYLMDIYRNKYPPERNLGHLALFISFFPQLIQGPISRFDEISKDYFCEHNLDWRKVCFGMQRMLWGYFKKLVVADRLAPVILAISQDTATWQGIYVWVGAICYTIQIYADFSGGIDIVIGVAELFGISLPENFERPYFSRTVAEYWRRWHMTLMLWLRENIFYPSSTCKPVRRLSTWTKRHVGAEVSRRVPVYSASILVWLFVGLWHGATWGYVIWGMINCGILLIAQEVTPLTGVFHQHFAVNEKIWFRCFQIFRTLFILSLVQMLEYYQTLRTMLKMQWNMFTESSIAQLFDGRLEGLGLSGADWLIVMLGVLLMLIVSMKQCSGSVRQQLAKLKNWQSLMVWYALLVVVLVFGSYGQGYNASQFIYNQF